MKFCSQCGSPSIIFAIPEGDDRERYQCSDCEIVFYQNPRVIVGCIVHHQDKVLLCRRAIQPRYGFWTIPCGFLENGESCEEGAIRETFEEAGAKAKIMDLYCVYDVLHVNQVYLIYRAEFQGDVGFESGIESLETQLVDIEEIPWDDLAFSSIRFALECFQQDVSEGQGFGLHKKAYNKNLDPLRN